MSVVQFPGKRSTFPTRTQHSGGDGGGGGIEARLGKLEAHMEHVQADCADIKADVRSVRDKVDDVKDAIWSAKVWALILYIGLAGVLLGTMAKGFGWLDSNNIQPAPTTQSSQSTPE